MAIALLVMVCALALGETKEVDATIAAISEKGMVLTVGTQPLAVEEGFETHFWYGKALAKRDAFKVGEKVWARIKTDADPPQLREIADKATGVWLSGIRKEPREGTVEKVDDRSVTVKFKDGTVFQYRATAKSKVQLKDKPEASLSDLTVGQHIWAKGRTLPTLDTWLVTITDTPLALPVAKAAGSKRGAKVKALPSTGKLSGTIIALIKPIRIFDVIVDEIRTLHITYDLETKFYLDGKRCEPDVMRTNMQFSATYRRDKFGRLIASKVELFSHPRA